MTLETDLAHTFAAHEDLAPDADQVLAAVCDRTRPRRATVRPWAVAATVAAMAAVGVGAVALTSDDASAPTQVAGSPTVSALADSSAPVVPATGTPAALTMPLDVGWLPDGTVVDIARRTQIGSVDAASPGVVNGEYLLTVTSASRALDVDVQQMTGGLAGASFKSGPGADVTIDGRAAVESSVATGPGGYEVYFLDGNGHLTYVNVANSPGATRAQAPAAELVATGRRIAASVVVPGTTQVTPDYGIGYVPAGLAVRTFEVASDVDAAPTTPGTPSAATRTSYGIGAPSAAETSVGVFVGTAPTTPPATPGRTVQGHPTTLTDDGGYRTLVVADAVGGQSICIAATLPADELYRIADGLVLPS